MLQDDLFNKQLEEIKKAFPDQPIISVKELSIWLKLDPRTIRSHYSVKPGIGISAVKLAQEMVEEKKRAGRWPH